MAVFLLTVEVLSAASPLHPPALSATAIKDAQFGPTPTAAEVQSSTRLKIVTAGPLLGRRTGFLALPSGVPQKMYLRMPDGSYQFGWAQALAFGGADNGIVARVYYYYAFFQNGLVTQFSRDPFTTCQQRLADLRGRSVVAVCGPMDRLPRLEHNCLLPQGGAASRISETACAQLGDAVEMTDSYDVQEKDHPITISPGMTLSEIKRAAKSTDVAFVDRSPDRILIQTSRPGAVQGLEAFLLRNGKIYARQLHDDEFPDK